MSVDLETATGKQVDVGTKPTTNGSLRVLAAVLAVLLLGTGYVIGNASKTQAPPVKRARDQAHPYYNVSTAIALVAGITRPQDGLVFGEWARLHASKICPSLVPASRWGIQAQNQPYGWYIYINVISGPYNSKSPCANDPRLDHPLYLAIVRHENGGIARIDQHWSGEFVMTADRQPLPPVVPRGTSLLEQFENGAAP